MEKRELGGYDNWFTFCGTLNRTSAMISADDFAGNHARTAFWGRTACCYTGPSGEASGEQPLWTQSPVSNAVGVAYGQRPAQRHGCADLVAQAPGSRLD